MNDEQTLLLEWANADSDEENFILVQSKRKKKEQRKLKNSANSKPIENKSTFCARRSKRTTPSVYRVHEGQENPGPNHLKQNKKFS